MFECEEEGKYNDDKLRGTDAVMTFVPRSLSSSLVCQGTGLLGGSLAVVGFCRALTG